MTEASRAEVCVVACAEAWRGDGEILASPMGLVPTIGCRLAKLTFAPDLLISDGEAYLLGEVPLAGPEATVPVIEGWLPYRAVFDVVASGRRHVMMGASQLDRFGNSNISCIGDWAKPKRLRRDFLSLPLRMYGVRLGGRPAGPPRHRARA